MIRSIFFKPIVFVAGILLCVPVALVTLAVNQYPADAAMPALKKANAFSLVELKVDNMSCSGCMATIESSLAGIQGIADIRVDVAGGKAAVTFDSALLGDVHRVVRAITASGYPASVLRVVPAAELERERRQAADRAATAIASVGGLLVSRADFEADLAHARSRYKAVYGETVFANERGKALLDNLKAQIASRLIDTRIQVSEIQRAGFTIEASVVKGRFQNFLKKQGMTREQFKASLEKNDYRYEDFMDKFRTRTLVSAYFDQKVAPGVEDEAEKKRLFGEWFANARLLARVVFFDEAVRDLIQAPGKGGCGQSCSATR